MLVSAMKPQPPRADSGYAANAAATSGRAPSMKTAKPTKISAAPPQFGSTRCDFRSERRAADRHLRHLDVVECPAGERDRSGDARAIVRRRIHVAERTRRGAIRREREIHVDRRQARLRRPSATERSLPVTVPLAGKPAAGVTPIDNVADPVPDAGLT